MESELTLRLERPDEYRTVEELTREAFWNNFQPGCDEHYLLHHMRNHRDYLPALSFIAVLKDTIVGSIVYSKSKVTRFDGSIVETITFGPISVHPEYQGKGIGSALIRHSAKVAREQGYPAIIIYGDPAYYARVGFRLGEKFDLRTPSNKYAVALQALLLQDNEETINKLGGHFEESDVFNQIEPSDVEAFDATFPIKEKAITDSQKRFEVLRSLSYPVVKMQF
jgi:predicted N-acetyltransferase YhbS